MNQKAFLALAILGIILVAGCVQQAKNKNVTSTPLELSFNMIGTPALNQEFTLELYAKNLNSESITPDALHIVPFQNFQSKNFELVGDNISTLSWSGTIPKQDTARISVKVKAVKTGIADIFGRVQYADPKTNQNVELVKKLTMEVNDDVSTSKVIREEYVQWQEP